MELRGITTIIVVKGNNTQQAWVLQDYARKTPVCIFLPPTNVHVNQDCDFYAVVASMCRGMDLRSSDYRLYCTDTNIMPGPKAYKLP